MADTKISNLTAATTPLDGTEVLPIVDDGVTVKVAVSNLTAGRSVSGTSFVPTGTTIPTNGMFLSSANAVGFATNSVEHWVVNASGNLNPNGAKGIGTALAPVSEIVATTGSFDIVDITQTGDANQFRTYATGNTIAERTYSTADGLGLIINSYQSQTGGAPYLRTSDIVASTGDVAGSQLRFFTKPASGSPVARIVVSKDGDATLSTGNLVIGTAGKGIDFSATANGAGTMTSELLSDYEEGTWTPTQGGGLTVVGAFSSSGRYTKVGRQVTVTGKIQGSTSVAATVGGMALIGNSLPFEGLASGAGMGNAINDNVYPGSILYVSTLNLLWSAAIPASPAIYFAATYFV